MSPNKEVFFDISDPEEPFKVREVDVLSSAFIAARAAVVARADAIEKWLADHPDATAGELADYCDTL